MADRNGYNAIRFAFLGKFNSVFNMFLSSLVAETFTLSSCASSAPMLLEQYATMSFSRLLWDGV